MILVAIGSNLSAFEGDTPLSTCIGAAEAIGNIAEIRLTALSHWYETVPIPRSCQPNYVNGVACLDGAIDPEHLLRILQAIEAANGRERSVANAARTLDLDIIAMGDIVRLTPDPILPHPRMHERAFVLQPLLDVAPGWRHPVSGRTARALLNALPAQGVRLLARSHLREPGATPN